MLGFKKELVAFAGDISQSAITEFCSLSTIRSTDSFGKILNQLSNRKCTSFRDLYLVDGTVRFALSTFGNNLHVTTNISTLWQWKQC